MKTAKWIPLLILCTVLAASAAEAADRKVPYRLKESNYFDQKSSYFGRKSSYYGKDSESSYFGRKSAYFGRKNNYFKDNSSFLDKFVNGVKQIFSS